jgi:hypothetical protein
MTGSQLWIFGNYWLLDQPEKVENAHDYYRLQLLGIGARLSEMPMVHECAVYGREIRHLRGSGLRAFIDFGKSLLLLNSLEDG